MSKHIKYGLKFVPTSSKADRVGEMYQQISQDLLAGMTEAPEPFTIHSIAPDILAGCWMIFRETLLAGRVHHGLKQTLATVVSQANDCPWCVDAHEIVMQAAGYGDALKANNSKQANPHTTNLIAWAKTTGLRDGSHNDVLPFNEKDAPEIIGCVLTFHYLNRMVNVLLDERTLPQQVWLRRPLQSAMSLLFRGHAKKQHPVGQSLHFLPEAPLLPEFKWADPSPEIASAFARFSATMDAVGEAVVPQAVRDVTLNYLAQWDGRPVSISRQWVEDAMRDLPVEYHAIARLTLLVAVAPHQISERTIQDFRQVSPDDKVLVETLAWGSYAAMRQINCWLVERHGLMTEH